ALYLERERPALAELDDPRVLPRPLQHPLPPGRQPPQERSGVLVAAVLAPHHAEERELEEVRLPPEEADDAPVLGVGEPERGVGLLRAQSAAPISTDRSIPSP